MFDYEHVLAGAAGDDALPADGDLAEDGEGVAGQEVQLGVPQLRVRHELRKPSVVTREVLLKNIFTPKL